MFNHIDINELLATRRAQVEAHHERKRKIEALAALIADELIAASAELAPINCEVRLSKIEFAEICANETHTYAKIYVELAKDNEGIETTGVIIGLRECGKYIFAIMYSPGNGKFDPTYCDDVGEIVKLSLDQIGLALEDSIRAISFQVAEQHLNKQLGVSQ